MKEELQSKLVEILTSIQTAAGKASDFALSQLPDIAQSYVAYGRAWALIEVILGALGVAFFVWGTRRMYVFMRDHDCLEATPVLALPSLATICTFIWLVSAAKGATLAWFAPKVWLLKELATFLK